MGRRDGQVVSDTLPLSRAPWPLSCRGAEALGEATWLRAGAPSPSFDQTPNPLTGVVDPRPPERRLERRDLVVDLRAVVEVVLVPAGSREEELDAVAAHAVPVARGAIGQ
jgi:hypothetical protein